MELSKTHRLLKNISLHCVKSRGGHGFIVVSVSNKESAVTAARTSYALIAEALNGKGLEILQERIFGSLSARTVVLRERNTVLADQQIFAGGPFTYVDGRPPWGKGLAGIIIHAISSDHANDVWTIKDGNTPCGRGLKHNGATCIILQNIASQFDKSSKNKSRSFQVQRMIDRAERILCENGASYSNVVRTWFYLSKILEWYASFNEVRNDKYEELGLMPGLGETEILLPASTGISAAIYSGAAATMDLLAIVEQIDRPTVRKLTNRTQLDAFRYGAAFSRGAVIQGDETMIQVSGTAAIDEHGVSLYPGNIHAQIACTFDKVNQLLEQEGAKMSDICAATVFVKRPEDARVYRQIAADRGLINFPAVCVVADICREELLFEIDAEVIMKL